MSRLQQIRLFLPKDKKAVKHLLRINSKLVFGNGLICALHPGRYAFSVIHTGSSSSNNFSVHDCTNLVKAIKSKFFDKITIDLSACKSMTEKPYRFETIIPEVADCEDMIEETKKRLEIIDQVLAAGSGDNFTSVDQNHIICMFEANNSILKDMTRMLYTNTPNFNGDNWSLKYDMKFETLNSKFQLSNETSPDGPSVDIPSNLPNTSVVLSKHSLPILVSALGSTDETTSRIVLADSAFVLVQNGAATTILNNAP